MNISFDVDGTLLDDFDGSFNKQKEEIQTLAKKHISNGDNVFIITKRYGPEYPNEGIKNEHLIVFQLANSLGIPIDRCYFTNRDWKISTILKLNIKRHYENSEKEVKMCQDSGIEVIPVEDPYWRDLVY